ncbi:hypothetical protein VR44_18870 [Streptomyces katrae]|uniref:Uncharacterized protein n=2 Tax=Streptomyces TaxID=1883 RepID=A0A0F4JA97_9ACTN|nr:hypothetical protein VR44_18870 [Streptomyces katrae]
MGQKAVRGEGPGGPEGDGTGGERKKLDLSLAQVAGSSLATVAAALLASKLGVYGTILGAGVVSVVATAGGPVIQHAFRRTGDRLREGARPKGGRLPAPARAEGSAAPPPGEFGEATVHGTRVRGWKRTAVASGAAFALAIGGLGTYEAFAGTSVSSGGGTLLSGGTRKAPDHRSAERKDGTDSGGRGGQGGRDGKGGEPGGSGNERSGSGSSPSPSASHGGRGPDPAPTPTPSRSAGPGPDPSPSASRQTPDPGPTPSGGGTGASGGATAGRE